MALGVGGSYDEFAQIDAVNRWIFSKETSDPIPDRYGPACAGESTSGTFGCGENDYRPATSAMA